jgi:hypothetical protein
MPLWLQDILILVIHWSPDSTRVRSQFRIFIQRTQYALDGEEKTTQTTSKEQTFLVCIAVESRVQCTRHSYLRNFETQVELHLGQALKAFDLHSSRLGIPCGQAVLAAGSQLPVAGTSTTVLGVLSRVLLEYSSTTVY